MAAKLIHKFQSGEKIVNVNGHIFVCGPDLPLSLVTPHGLVQMSFAEDVELEADQ